VLDLEVGPAELRERIARRTARMFAEGLVEETRALLRAGAGPALEALRAIGYDEAMALIAGHLDLAAAEARVNLRTAQLAKRQRTWFRHQVQGLTVAAGGLAPGPLEDAALDRLRAAGFAVG
jgi:tRNA dimethylallyltransferase